MRLLGPQSWSGILKKRIYCPSWVWILDYPNCSLVSVPSELSWLHMHAWVSSKFCNRNSLPLLKKAWIKFIPNYLCYINQHIWKEDASLFGPCILEDKRWYFVSKHGEPLNTAVQHHITWSHTPRLHHCENLTTCKYIKVTSCQRRTSWMLLLRRQPSWISHPNEPRSVGTHSCSVGSCDNCNILGS